MRALYSKDFVLFEAERPDHYSESHALGKLTSFRYTPVFVFLDADGRKVAETRGFRSPLEAKALHEFVSQRLYLKTTLQEHMQRYPK